MAITRTLFLHLITLFAITSVTAQPSWNNKKCAVVLTYDDALHGHLDNVIPVLDSAGLKGTFYLSAYMPGCKERIEDWRVAAKHGHELGNHTLYHPCIGHIPGRQWVVAERDLGKYSMERFVDEIRMTNIFLQAIDGKSERTFAYPCGDTVAQGQSVIPKIKEDFVSARGVKSEYVPLNTKNLYNVDAFMVNGNSSLEMIAMVKEAVKKNTMIVFLFHGVGGDHSLNIGLKEHRELIKFLKANEQDIWVAPFIDVTKYIKSSAQATK